jgi:hypothetical protein
MRELRADRLLYFAHVLAGYGCAGIDQEADDETLCGKCGPCEAAAFLQKYDKPRVIPEPSHD